MKKRVYIAGPDVFYPDAVAHGEALKSIAAQFNLEGLFPLDATIDSATPPHLKSRLIADANRKLLESADLVVANLRPFRGPEPDSGTVWECGYAAGRGIRVIGYHPPTASYAATVRAKLGLPLGVERDAEGLLIEDFGTPLNLMLAHSMALVVGDFTMACRLAKNWLRC